MPTRIYSYGALEPRTNLDVVRDQLQLAHRYRNRLVEIERQRRDRVENCVRHHFPLAVTLSDAANTAVEKLKAARKAILERNAKAQKKTETRVEKVELRQLRQEVRNAWEAYSKERKKIFARPEGMVGALKKAKDRRDAEFEEAKPLEARKKKLAREKAKVAYERDLLHAYQQAGDFWAMMYRIEQENALTLKQARADCGVYWSSYLCIEDQMREAREGAPPRFKRYEGEGKNAVQIQGGMSADEVLSCGDTRLRMASEGHLNKQHWVCQFRVHSDPKGAPIFAEVPFIMSRPIPEGATIKWAYLVLRRVGTREEWFLQLVLDAEEFPRDWEQATEGQVAINLGWRQKEQGKRVAVWLGSDGHQGELVIEEKDLQRWKFADHLRSIRDRVFNEWQNVLASWYGEHRMEIYHPDLQSRLDWLVREARGHRAREEKRCQERAKELEMEVKAVRSLMLDWSVPKLFPEWFVERTERLAYWRSPNRLAGLIAHWEKNRFVGDELIFPVMQGWQKTDKHLYDWEAGMRKKASRWRKWYYRNFAADLARQYRTVVLADIDYSKLRVLPELEDDDENQANYAAAIASPGELAACLKYAFADVQKRSGVNLTKTCAQCGTLNEFDARTKMSFTCADCGTQHDQDINHCKNLLASAGATV